MKYSKPQLTHLGSLAELTLGSSVTGVQDVRGDATQGQRGSKS